MGGGREEGGRRWEGRRGRGRRGTETARRGELGLEQATGPTLSGPLPPWASEMPNPGIGGRSSGPGSQSLVSLGAQTESEATEVGLQGYTANQKGRRRKAGKGLGAPIFLFS